MMCVCVAVHADTMSLEEFAGVSFHTKCCESRITAFILQYLPSAYLKWESSQELHYILPFGEAHKGGFERLFQVNRARCNAVKQKTFSVITFRDYET